MRALKSLLEEGDLYSEGWEERLSVLGKLVHEHIDEEERLILNEARSQDAAWNTDVGERFQKVVAYWITAVYQVRAELIGTDCGNIDNIRSLAGRNSIARKVKEVFLGTS